MTSMTMVVGMLPLALSRGSSSEIKSSMAILLVGGIITSTLLSPILIPVVYTLIDDARHGLRKRGRPEPKPVASTTLVPESPPATPSRVTAEIQL